RKLTALGRFSHEAATTALAADGRVVVYMGDDDKFEYVYKFVSRERFDPARPERNARLLDDGVLFAARFDADGSGRWLPLVYDPQGPLSERNGFRSQGDVCLQARAAADLLGATPMDRPEDVQPNPVNGRVYIACTKNPDRAHGARRGMSLGREIDLGVDAANPRGENHFGHVIELLEAGADAAATEFEWNVLLLAGGGVGNDVACPDNLGYDPLGRLWIVTDTDDPSLPNNGCFVVDTAGPMRGVPRQMLSGPVGAEICGCELTPDGTTLFLCIQHPGEGGSVDAPISHWPDGGTAPPRSALIALRRDDGEPV
ncbi:MAG: DUF839 domain-containing protein, partial [Steroidobacteraceae bacterium]|nr:DUF839 domain-containing protein [Steroidobacteraceae bacterium]MDW8259884.1 DUF839 domain-containing protein [Gammaproteobacteria bacterium]